MRLAKKRKVKMRMSKEADKNVRQEYETVA
jgi:hypothetical protein